MSKTFSGKTIVHILEKYFGFDYISTRGDHVKLRRVVSGKAFTTIIPLHAELAQGTLSGILKLANISKKEFLEIVQK